ncbi:hypothetical protein J2T09_000504 [Neorhizobium huautlense]|uniref:Uncharacterized protein n=1 Tax=Neorhizobium huautlense TaxID=67774 RepID=A0ABT9PMS3_9HYPH|nr:hypothetical protein [Neorhizobium huautlense]MDP9835763.1 hypothetical protein [Neorhizobium huautlense]
MRITWFLLIGILVAMVLSILLIDTRIPAPPSLQPGQTEPAPANPLAPPPGQP